MANAQSMDMLRFFREHERDSAEDAYQALISVQEPLSQRLSNYVLDRRGEVAPSDRVQRALKARDILKSLGKVWGFGSSWEKCVDYWTDNTLRVRSIEPDSVFKLCLILNLSLKEARDFVGNTLFQEWFSCRSAEETTYQFFIVHQHLFGFDSYSLARETVKRYESFAQQKSDALLDNDATLFIETTRLTKHIQTLLEAEGTSPINDSKTSLDVFAQRLRANASCFDNVSRSSKRFFQDYVLGDVSRIGNDIFPLKKYYGKDWHARNNGSSLFDPKYHEEHPNSPFPISALANREKWRKDLSIIAERLNDSLGPELFDPVPSHLFATSRKANSYRKRGIPRGNLIAAVFLQHCAENSSKPRETNPGELLEQFYEDVNYVLCECSMLPLQPRNMFDAIFLQAMAYVPSKRDTRDFYIVHTEYLSFILNKFYPRSASWNRKRLYQATNQELEQYRRDLLEPYRDD